MSVHPIRPDPDRVKPERFGDYRDFLKRPSRSWAIEHTEKKPGQLVATGTGFDRHG